MEYQKISEVLIEIILDIAKTTKETLTSDLTIYNKGTIDYVSSFDLKIEHELVKRLLEKYPEIGIIAEESFHNIYDGFFWVIDPIDGTTNFIHHLKHYTISVALVEVKNMKVYPKIGVVCAPMLNELYYSILGGLSYKICDVFRDKKIKVIKTSETTDMIKSIGSFGFPYDINKNNLILKKISNFLGNVSDLKRIGPSSLDLCLVAEGVIDFYFELDLKLWDIAAAIIIVRNAGGHILDWNRNKWDDINVSNIVATNGIMDDLIIHILNK